MKERAADMAAPAAGAGERLPLRVAELKKRFIGARRDQRRIVEFMPAYHTSGPSERAVREKPRFPIAEMQLARGEAGRMSKQAGLQRRITGGEPAGIAVGRGRLVGKRGKRHDLGTGAPPAVAQVRIEKC